MKKQLTPWLVAGAILGAGALSALAHSGATGVVLERMNGMMMLAEQVKSLNLMLVGNTELDRAKAAIAAEMISKHAGSAMLDLFPEGSIEGPSVAKAEIWERWSEFEALAQRLGELGDELGEAVLVSATVVEPQNVAVAPVLSEWEQLDTEMLLGLKTRQKRKAELDSAVINLTATSTLPQKRAPKDVFTDIAANCSACHSAFRR